MSNILQMHDDIKEKLEERAWELSNPFCYTCFRKVPVDDTACPTCFSDDLMRYVHGVGCEYGIEWVMAHIVESQWNELNERDQEERFIELLDDIYEEVKIGYATFSPGDVLKAMDPVAFRIGVSEEIDNDINEGRIVETSKGYYSTPCDLQP